MTALLPPEAPILEADHLRMHFPMRQFQPLRAPRVVHAVEDVTFALRPGRALALVGESGSGKTTVARLLARLHAPTAGRILFRGEPVADHGRAGLLAFRRHVQMVFQDPFSSLNPVHDVRYHLSRVLRLHHAIRSRADETERMLTLLEKVSLTPSEQII